MNHQKYQTAFSIIVCIFLHVSLNGNFIEASVEVYDAVSHTNHAISTAIADIIEVYFFQQGIPFDIHVYGNRTANISQILNEILHQKEKNISVTTVKWFPNATEQNMEFNQSAVVFFVDQIEIPKSTLTNEFPKKLKFLFFCLPGMCSLRFGYNYQLLYLGVFPFYYGLDLKQNSLYLYSSEWWWPPNNCMKYDHNIHNIFSIEKFAWQWKLENHKKFQNFYGCQLTVGPEVDFPIYYPEKKKNFSHLIEMFQIMGQLRNFEPHYEIISNEHDFLFPGKNLFLNLFLNWSYMISGDLMNQQMATTFSEKTLKFIIPPGDLYTPYEKMLLPFDEQTWWFLIAVFAAAFSIIFLVNLMPQSIKNLLYGDGVNMPAFNVVGTFFGIGQMKLPEGNFARIILITFIIFCLIIRTAYQGVQFEMLTKEMRRKPAQSIQQLYDENYTFLGGNDTKTLIALKQMIEPSKSEQVQVIGYDLVDVYSAVRGMNQSVKRALLQSTDDIRKIGENVDTLIVLPEVFFTCTEGMSTPRNSFLFPALEEALQLTIPTGIAQYHLKIYNEHRYNLTNKERIESGPEVFSINSLSFGFVVWLIACGVSTCGLILEFIHFFFMKFISKTEIFKFYQKLYGKDQQQSVPTSLILDSDVLNDNLDGLIFLIDETTDAIEIRDHSVDVQDYAQGDFSYQHQIYNYPQDTMDLNDIDLENGQKLIDKVEENEIDQNSIISTEIQYQDEITESQHQKDENARKSAKNTQNNQDLNVSAIFGESIHFENDQELIDETKLNQIIESLKIATTNPDAKLENKPNVQVEDLDNENIYEKVNEPKLNEIEPKLNEVENLKKTSADHVKIKIEEEIQEFEDLIQQNQEKVERTNFAAETTQEEVFMDFTSILDLDFT